MKVRKENLGFTLVELLFVTALLAVIGLALYSTFSSGINFWLRLTEEKAAEDVIFFFEKISQDLRNTFRYTGIDFAGSSDKVGFPIISDFQTKEGRARGIGKIDYIFDRNRNIVKVKQSSYSEAYLGRTGYERELVKGVQSLIFQYYYYDPAEKKYYWASSWQSAESAGFGVVEEKKIPLAVRIQASIKEGDFSRKLQRTVFLPASYYSSFMEE